MLHLSLWSQPGYSRQKHTYSGVSCSYDGRSVCSLSAAGETRPPWYPADPLRRSDRRRTSRCVSPQALCCSWQRGPGSKHWEIVTDARRGNVAVQRIQNHSLAGRKHSTRPAGPAVTACLKQTSLSENHIVSRCLLHWLHSTYVWWYCTQSGLEVY